MEEPATVSVAEAALATGFTRQSIYRAIRDGRLNRHLVRDSKGQARLMPEALTAIRSGLLRLRADSAAGHTPTTAPAPAPAPAPDPQTLWANIATWANELLDTASWGPPPWTGDQWSTLAVVLEQADDLEAEHGAYRAGVLEQECEE
jgi:hypothetical protein